MKKHILALFSITIAVTATFGQSQKAQCMSNLSMFSEFAKIKNYEAAYEPWKMVYENCPELHKATYVYGKRILEYKISKASQEDRTTHINQLLEMYDSGNKYFPKKYPQGRITAYKGILSHKENLSSNEELYNMLNDAFTADRANFKVPKALYLYFSVLVDLHKDGKEDLQQVFDTYDDVVEKIDTEKSNLVKVINTYIEKEQAGKLYRKERQKLKNARSNLQLYRDIAPSIDAKMGTLADCDKLIPLYEKNFESKKTDAVWLKRAAGRMNSKDCTDNSLFVTMVGALHELEPSADSAYYLGLLNDKSGKNSEAIKYYNEAVALEKDTYKKAKILYKIATKFKNKGQLSNARNYAQKALNYQPSMGAAYLLIAKLYEKSANQCGSTPFEKRAIYWKAAEIARKAGKVDTSLKGQANTTVGRYEQLAPDKTMIFNNSMAGKTINFNCWIGGSVTVPPL